MASRVRECRIDREPRKREQPSDHAPVIARIDLDDGEAVASAPRRGADGTTAEGA
jgi:hypothetical protein